MNLEVFKSLLKRTQINIDTAESGDECLELSGNKKYDIIFLDHMMPGKDGIETLHELRAAKNDPNKDTPVVCITANVIKGSEEMYISEGFNDHMTKPVDAGLLEEILLKYLPQDKIKPDTSDETGGEDQDMIPDELKALAGNRMININNGIKNSGSVESYIPLLKIFYSSMDEKKEELNRYLSEGDIKNYTIKIHALKSSARIIGAADLGDAAEALEYAGKDGDIDYIKEHHGPFMEDYEAFRAPLSEMFKENEDDTDKPEADEDLLRDVFKELRSAADDMDCDRLQAIFKEMEAYRVPEKYTLLWKSLKEASGNYDYDVIIELIDNEGN
jgi:CheY-like chemotaxis protein